MDRIFKITCYLSGLLFFYLVYLLFFNVEPFLIGIGLSVCNSAIFLAKRASMLMLGFALLSIFCSKITETTLRVYASIVLSVVWMGLASMSAYETFSGNINAGLIPAMIIETLFGVSFALMLMVGIKNGSSEQK